MAFDNPQPGPTSNNVPLGDKVVILPNNPLPDLNTIGGPTFAASYRGNEGGSDLMAILCNLGLPPRLDFITTLRTLDHPCHLRMIDNGVVLWPHDNTRHYAFAFQRPLSPRLKHSIDEVHHPLSEDAINHYFVEPLISALIELARVGIIHNAIRPTNIFWRLGSATSPQLGECLSAPAGYGQPVLFEPIERAMCLPTGRGVGQHVDDCYALGVTFALMFLGRNPLQGLSDEAIIQTKIERGSFMALVGNNRLPATHIELLRGLLNDDGRQRWSANDLEQWLNGRRLTPKNTDSGRRASRAFAFYGKEYWQTRPLAAALASNVSEAVQIIENGSLDKWLRRALGDDERAENLQDVQRSIKESGKTANYEDQLIARTCIALDPPAPIRYRGLSVMPMGLANVAVETALTGNHLQLLAEIISSQLVSFWIEMQKDLKSEYVALGQQFERMKNLIEKTTYGNGFERIVYELNPGLNCLSPFLRPQYVTSPKTLLPGLERIAQSGTRPREPMDRHIAAFLIVRDRRSELLFEAMSNPEGSIRRGIALLTLLAELQYRFGPEALPALTQWMVPLIEPCVNRFLSKVLRDKAHAQIREIAQRGDLNTLLRLVDDPKRVETDRQEFMAARMLYLNLMKEVALLESRLTNRESVVRGLGKPMAASISTFIAIVLIFFALVRSMWQALHP